MRRLAAGAFAAVLAAAPFAAHADTVASLLGNFTINQHSLVALAPAQVAVRHTVVYGQLPALRELHAADADGDGVTTQIERDAHAARLAPVYAEGLRLTVDDVRVPLHAARWTTSLPVEQGGFSLRIDVDLEGVLPASARRGRHQATFANDNHAGRFGWQEIVLTSAPAISVFATDASSTSLTAGLTENVAQMPDSGPLRERAVRFSFTDGAVPAGATALAPRPGTTSPQAATAAPADDEDPAAWLMRATHRLVAAVSGPEVPVQTLLAALLAAVVLGALHAFAPGHGKAVVGAYLIGSRATARHALFLGATVTVTHTIGVFALGFATLAASAYVVPERLFPALSLTSGLLVLGMGIVLLAQRVRSVRVAPVARAAGSAYRTLALSTPPGRARAGFVPAYVGHDLRGTSGWHSHGGVWHTHLPPGATGEPVTWRSLLALGVSGGLVPCPSAMVLLLAAVALNRTGYGLLLVVAFSLGLATTLSCVGLAFLYARRRLHRGVDAPAWTRTLPVASAAAITLLGLLLCYQALANS